VTENATEPSCKELGPAWQGLCEKHVMDAEAPSNHATKVVTRAEVGKVDKHRMHGSHNNSTKRATVHRYHTSPAHSTF